MIANSPCLTAGHVYGEKGSESQVTWLSRKTRRPYKMADAHVYTSGGELLSVENNGERPVGSSGPSNYCT